MRVLGYIFAVKETKNNSTEKTNIARSLKHQAKNRFEIKYLLL